MQDWSDLWRPELAGKISMVDSPREIVGAVLKSMGASYNTTNIDSQVVGGKHAVLQQLELLAQQVTKLIYFLQRGTWIGANASTCFHS